MVKLEKMVSAEKFQDSSQTNMCRAFSNPVIYPEYHLVSGTRGRKVNKGQCLYTGLLGFKVCLEIILQLKQEKPRICHYLVVRQGLDTMIWVSVLHIISSREYCGERRKYFPFHCCCTRTQPMLDNMHKVRQVDFGCQYFFLNQDLHFCQ